jgi:hypothetical protein
MSGWAGEPDMPGRRTAKLVARSITGWWRRRWFLPTLVGAPTATVAAGMAVSVLVISGAYAASRAGQSSAPALLWLGEALLYAVPAAFLLRARHVTRSQGAHLALLIPLATYVINQAYSPGQLRFLDEFEHVVTAQGILSSHHLFTQNISLLVSPQYPGLEIVTSAVVSLTHLSITFSAIVVVGVLHCLTAFGIYLLALEITSRPRWAALAVLIYACEPHYQFFDSYFIYQVMALPFLVSCVLAAARMVKASSTRAALIWGGASLLLAAVTVMSHHLTSYVTWLLLMCFFVGTLLTRGRSGLSWRLPTLLLVSGGLIFGWDLGVATATIAYFQHNLLSLGVRHASRKISLTTSGVRIPPFESALEYASVAMLCGLTMLGGVWVWRNRRKRGGDLVTGFGLASLSLLLAIVGRLLFSGGAQLWGRAATFAMIPACLLVAAALRVRSRPSLTKLARLRPLSSPSFLRKRSGVARVQTPDPGHAAAKHPQLPNFWPRRRRDRRQYRYYSWAGVAALVILALGGIAGGWPPSYARLPGPFLAEAWERSVDAHELDLAAWAATRITRNNGVASDFTTASLLGTIGHQANVGGLPALFFSTTITVSDVAQIRARRVILVVVDQRLLKLPPEDGSYFSGSGGPASQARLLPRTGLDKFASVPGVSRIFDDGSLVVYDLTGSALP